MNQILICFINHYTTRFIDGLKPSVRMVVAVQRPADLDNAYSIAAVQEEMGEMEREFISPVRKVSPSYRQNRTFTNKTSEEYRTGEVAKGNSSSEDKLATLKAYRRAKGLCFICGERWVQDHKCSTTVQLHVVQEMLQFCSLDSTESDDSDVDLMVLSADTQTSSASSSAIRLDCQIAAHEVVMLLDSGSSHSFISSRLAAHLSGVEDLSQQQEFELLEVVIYSVLKCYLTVNGLLESRNFSVISRYCLCNIMMESLVWIGCLLKALCKLIGLRNGWLLIIEEFLFSCKDTLLISLPALSWNYI